MNKLRFAGLFPVLALVLSTSSFAESSIEQLTERANLTEGPVAVRDLQRYTGPRKVLVRDIGVDMDALSAAYPDVEFIAVATVAEAMQHAPEADAIAGYCDEDLIRVAPRLVWIQIYAAGAERCLSVSQIAGGHVLLTNMQKMSSPVIAEHAITMMMALARKLPQYARVMPSGQWARDATTTSGMMPIAGKTLLVVGLGGIGTEVARLGAALDMRVVGTRNSSRAGPEFVEYVGLSHELGDLVATADVIVNALPLTDDTRGMFNREIFDGAKPGAIFVNVGRGQTVVTKDLVVALQSGKISGAGLDVTDPEPLPADHPLWQLPNVIVTPHVAGRGGERERHITLLTENLHRYIAGERLLNVVDPQRGY